jgi:peptidoglycan/LPS O-acetylase OafA/YrhL
MNSISSTSLAGERKGGRLEHVDALRGIAAMLVVFQHVATAIARHPQAPQWWIDLIGVINKDYFSPGRTGVVAFFLISGYVIPFSLKGSAPLRTFAISRFFRLYPAYWLSLALATTLLPALGLLHFSNAQILANITMLQFLLRKPDVIQAYWTLFIEMAFYAACFTWFLFGVLKNTKFLVTVILTLLAAAILSATVRYNNPDSSLPVGYINFIAAMHIGTLARLATIEQDQKAKLALPWVVAAALLAAPFISWLAYSKTPEVDPWISGITGLLVGYGLFFYCITKRVFASNVTIFLGAISYSLYLLHGVMLRIVRSFAYDWPWPSAAVLMPLLVLAIAIPLAWAVYRFIERPSVKLGSLISKKIEKTASQRLGTAVAQTQAE